MNREDTVMHKTFEVKAFFDREAEVWCAEGVNFEGLSTWAENPNKLLEKVKIMILDLIDANQEMEADEIPLHLLMESTIISNKSHCA